MVPVLLGHTSDEFYSKPNVDSLDEFKKMAIERFGSDADDYLNLCQFESGNLDDVLSNASVRTIEYAIRIAGQVNSDRGAEMPLYYYNFDL